MKRFLVTVVAFLPWADTTVLIKNGKAVARRGMVRGALLSELEDLAKDTGVDTACIHAVTQGAGSRLDLFGVPEQYRQRFYNVWNCNKR